MGDDKTFAQIIQDTIDQKTKPPGSLGRLESLAKQIALVQQTVTPSLQKPAIIVFAADHGLADEGVSAFPKAVTAQMVQNFIQGGAAINVFAKQHGLDLDIVDAGVDADWESASGLIDQKVAHGTQNMRYEPAMTQDQMQTCLDQGRVLSQSRAARGTNIIGFGEMGIGNTSAAALLMHYVTRISLADCVGAGTGLDQEGVVHKLSILSDVSKRHQPQTLEEAMACFGGFEILHMMGAMLGAKEAGMLILVDGFIATIAYALAREIEPLIQSNAVFTHQSAEQGHTKLLQWLDATPLLSLDMRLGEGSGCAVAYPIVESAVGFLNEMASFADAGVSERDQT